jgi:hypothetical protein
MKKRIKIILTGLFFAALWVLVWKMAGFEISVIAALSTIISLIIFNDEL